MYKATRALCPVCQRFNSVVELAGVTVNDRQAYVLTAHPSLKVPSEECGGVSARVVFAWEVKCDEQGPV